MVGGVGVSVFVADVCDNGCAITPADISPPPTSVCDSAFASGKEIVPASPQVLSCPVSGINFVVCLVVNFVQVASPPSPRPSKSPSGSLDFLCSVRCSSPVAVLVGEFKGTAGVPLLVFGGWVCD